MPDTVHSLLHSLRFIGFSGSFSFRQQTNKQTTGLLIDSHYFSFWIAGCRGSSTLQFCYLKVSKICKWWNGELDQQYVTHFSVLGYVLLKVMGPNCQLINSHQLHHEPKWLNFETLEMVPVVLYSENAHSAFSCSPIHSPLAAGLQVCSVSHQIILLFFLPTALGDLKQQGYGFIYCRLSF